MNRTLTIIITTSLLSMMAAITIKAKVTLKFWSWYTMQKPAYDVIIKDFESEHPDIKIESRYFDTYAYVKQISAAFIADQAPDIFGIQPDASVKGFITFIDSNRILNLTPYWQQWNLKDKFYKSVVTQLKYKDNYYSIPTSINNLNIIYNKTIFEKYNLTVPKNYSELKEIANTLKEHKISALSLGNKNKWTGKDYFFTLVGQINPMLINELNNEKITIDDPRFLKVLKKLLQLKKDGIFATGINAMSNHNAFTLFAQQKAAMYFTGTWALPNIMQNMPNSKNLGVIQFPVIMDKGKIISPGGVGMNIAINNKTAYKKEALEFIRFLSSARAQKYIVSKIDFTAANKEANNIKINNKYLSSYNKFQNNTSSRVILNVDLDLALSNALQGLWAEELSPEEAIEDIKDNM